MAIRQVSDGNPDGTTMGQAPSDKISFHGATPVVQQSATDLATVIAALKAYGLLAP